jgi:hypothetical protein
MDFKSAIRFIDTNEDKSEVRQLLIAVAQRLGALHEIEAFRICSAAARALEPSSCKTASAWSSRFPQAQGNSRKGSGI